MSNSSCAKYEQSTSLQQDVQILHSPGFGITFACAIQMSLLN